MSDIYRLDNLGGMTVGASQSLDNFAEVIDHLFENYPYKDVLDGSDLDDIDPETEHGDEMCDRLAGK